MAEYRGDIYSKSALRDSTDHFRSIRDLGPAVWLPKYKLWAVGRFDDVRGCLRADDKLISGKGIAANPILNGLEAKITLTSDGDVHKRRRSVLMKPLGPGELKNLQQRIQGEADSLVARLKKESRFDAMPAFASYLPVSIVAELVGLKPAGRENMLRWAAGAFEAIGPLNWRTLRALPALLDMRRYATNLKRADVVPGGWADKIFAAAEDGSLSLEEAQAMVIDYVAPSLDTTILATGNMLRYLAQSPDAFAAVKNDEKLLTNAVYEAARLASPIRGFTRCANEDFDVSGVMIPKGARALILYASANRDERHYVDPDRFDLSRNARDNVAWGHGQHVCVGMHLARLEMECLLRALAQQVSRIETGEPTPFLNNVLQGYKSLPTTFH
ncbi:MAG: cytochrome P450 [Micropepsaceae bacterium]